jgi:hypothetical protein
MHVDCAALERLALDAGENEAGGAAAPPSPSWPAQMTIAS